MPYGGCPMQQPPNAKERYTCENSVNVYPALLEAIDLGRELPNHCARVPGGVVHSVYPKLNAVRAKFSPHPRSHVRSASAWRVFIDRLR
eukprot:362291-Chlamydomonas_euryale.AAC.1